MWGVPFPTNATVGMTRVRYVGDIDGIGAGVGFALFVTGSPAGTDLADLATDMYGAFETNLLPICGAHFTLHQCLLKYWDGANVIDAGVAAIFPGGVSGDQLSAQACCVISWLGGGSYRGGHPRTYIPSMVQANLIDAAHFTDAYLNDVTDAGNAFITDVNGITAGGITGVALGVIHEFSGGSPLSPSTFNQYTGARVQPRVCTQRHRLGRETF